MVAGLAMLSYSFATFPSSWCSFPSPKPPYYHSVSPFAFLDARVRSLPADFTKISSGDIPVAKHVIVRCSNPESAFAPQNEINLVHAFFGEMGLKEKEIEILLKRNPALKLATFDSVRDRCFLLQSAGVEGVNLYRLISKHPNVLIVDEIESFLHFVVNDLPGKIEPAKLRRLLSSAEPTFLVDFDKKVRLLLDYGVPEEKIVHVLNKINLTKAFCYKSVEEIDKILTFLRCSGGIDLVVKRPAVMNLDLDTQLTPKVEYLKKASGGDEVATGILLRKLPFILIYTREHMTSQLQFLSSFAGLTQEQTSKILHVFPSVMSASIERKLRPRIELLKQCGLSSDEIFKFLCKAPLFMGLSFKGNIVHKLVFLVKIGYRHGTKEFAMALGAVTRTSCGNLQDVMGLFLSYGLSCEDIYSMSRRHPQILQYRCDSLEERMNYLIEEMGRDIGELLGFPAFLGYNIGRIKHRYEEKKKVSGEVVSINKLLTVSADRFSTGRKRKKRSQSRLTTLMIEGEG